MVDTVLYAGQPGTPRAESFRALLSEHFAEVRVDSLERVGELDLQGVDLVVVDGEPMGVNVPAELTADVLPLPTVLIGGAGGKVSDSIGLKLGWQYGCLCMDQRAIVEDSSLQHPIFEGPVPVPDPQLETIATPANFFEYAGSKDVPEKLVVADIHDGPRPKTDEEQAALQARVQELIAAGDHAAVQALIAEQPTPGLVSTSAGFLDSPDCERILGGINMKAHDYVAIGRQGRFLSWGFHGDPSTMTELGKALFLNCLHYISRYGWAPVESLRVSASRELLHTTLGFLGMAEAGDAEQLLRREFGDEIPDGIGTTAASAKAWWAVNSRFLRRVGGAFTGHYEIDPDLVALGVGNNDLALLDLIAPRLADDARARVLWERYVRRSASDAATEQAWLAEHRDSMFFSDWAGYRWIARGDLPALTVPRSGMKDEGPVTVAVSAERAGDVLTATVSFYLQPGYYLYAPGASDGIPVSVVPASDHTQVEPVEFPATTDGHLSGRPSVKVRLAGASDEVELDVTIQACNEQSCTPPSTLRLRAVAAG